MHRYAVLCFLGNADPKMVDTSKALVAGINAGINAACDGNTINDMGRALNAELIKKGSIAKDAADIPLTYLIHQTWVDKRIK